MNEFEKKLIESSERTVQAQEQVVEEIKLLLGSMAAEEIQTLKSIGLTADIEMGEEKVQDFIIRDANKSKFGRPVVSRKEIEDMCKKYRLYMRPAHQYIGRIPANLGADLNRFRKQHNIAVGHTPDTNSKFMIIAPPKMFKGYTNPLRMVINTIAKQDPSGKPRPRRLPADMDPVLVYEAEKDYFVIVKSWGRDFTPLRRLYGVLTNHAGFFLHTLNILIGFFGIRFGVSVAVEQSYPFWVQFGGGLFAVLSLLAFLLVGMGCIGILRRYVKEPNLPAIAQSNYGPIGRMDEVFF